ncbi:hypothetical protein AVEN_76744-1 [Araneus ventricosus]|uniref:Uncharacterized protein n=1 Tax=Araneus ventricosus TaxID=182803 RepID=A0A4Y2VAB4_ARAVE|nr:hypothetical protein AVEN_76744-1 [Araneus ventricosus]
MATSRIPLDQQIRCVACSMKEVHRRMCLEESTGREHRAAAAGVGIVTPEIQINTPSICDTDNSQNVITANATTVHNWMDQTFPGRWIEHRGSIECPARCPDLTSSDFFLWNYLKDKIYSGKISSLQDLKDVITTKMTAVSRDLCAKWYEIVSLRLQARIDTNGMQVDHTIEKPILTQEDSREVFRHPTLKTILLQFPLII